jgi:N-acetylglucosamine-6-phosphate deacetylase
MTHLRHGTTTLLPTVLGGSSEETYRSIDILREMQKGLPGGPRMPGLHLEGPYLNALQKGAISEKHLRNPNPVEYEAILDYGAGLIARWTVAVELDGALALGRRLRQLGILPSIGHSDAEYSQVAAAFRQGYTHVTHLYSAMSTIVRRGGFRYAGVIESAYCLEDMTVEVIADGCHLPVEMLRMVYRQKGAQKVCLTSDSMRCAGLETTEGVLGGQGGGQRVIIEDGVAKLPDRSAFAGSIATDDQLVRMMHEKAGVPLVDCVRMMSLTPAEILGIAGRTGSIEVGKEADLAAFDEDIRILGVMVGGNGLTGLLQ